MESWYNWLVDYVPKGIRKRVSTAFRFMKQKVLSYFNNGEKELEIKERKALLNRAIVNHYVEPEEGKFTTCLL